jgi:hypothetical protein
VADRPDDLELARLILARQRRLGTPWEQAWAMVFEALPAPGERHPRVNGREREATRTALKATEEDWRRAFLREPPREPPYGDRANARRLAEMHAVAA